MGEKLKLGIINIMPNARAYEQLLKASFDDLRSDVDTHMIRLSSHGYESSTDVWRHYSGFESVIGNGNLDLMIITGAPVEDRTFESIHYWAELMTIVRHSESVGTRMLGICFGGLALGRYFGASKRVVDEKIFGSYRLHSASSAARATEHLRQDDMYFSTWAVLEMTEAFADMALVVADHPHTGPAIATTRDHKHVMVMGHPEYRVTTLRDEWRRDVDKGLNYASQYDEDYFSRLEERAARLRSNLIREWIKKRCIGSHGASAYRGCRNAE